MSVWVLIGMFLMVLVLMVWRRSGRPDTEPQMAFNPAPAPREMVVNHNHGLCCHCRGCRAYRASRHAARQHGHFGPLPLRHHLG